jgi:beta-mannosidase
LYACLHDAGGAVLARTNALADIERRITFPSARLDVQVSGDALVLTTDRFARSVVLEGRAPDGDRFGWFFEDNWFDLMPGERKVVRVLGDHRAGQISARAWYSEHVSTVNWARL